MTLLGNRKEALPPKCCCVNWGSSYRLKFLIHTLKIISLALPTLQGYLEGPVRTWGSKNALILGKEDGKEENKKIYKSIRDIFELKQDHAAPLLSYQVVSILKTERVLSGP